MNRMKKLLLPLLLFILCISFSFTSAAAISTKNIKTVSGGKFIQDNSGWKYQYKNGKYAKNCLLNINGKTYCFSNRGYRYERWRKINGQYYFFGTSSEGYMYKNRWLKTANNNYYLFKKNGQLTKGLGSWGGKKYYFDPQTGKRLSGWQTIKKKRYYFGTDDQAWMRINTFVKSNGSIYFVKRDGTCVTGWATLYGNRFYFDKKGRAYTGSHTINGVSYNFNKTGVLTSIGPNLDISSDCALLIDANTNEVLYSRNADTRHANASTTKIMTCILALENCKLNEKVTASYNAASQEPTKLYMRAGETFYMKDLLYSLMLPSHNDTAVAIAEHISGSTSKFAALMNKKAKALGCTRTHFVTPNGLDNGLDHYTTARDLAKMAKYALKNSTFCQIVSTANYNFRSLSGTSYSITTTNELLSTMPGMLGIKTGYTNKAGYCFVGAVKGKSGHTYISVTLGASTGSARWSDTQKLLQYACSQKL